MKERLEEIGIAWEKFLTDATLFAIKGNKSAARRSRKASVELAALLKGWRKDTVEGQQDDTQEA